MAGESYSASVDSPVGVFRGLQSELPDGIGFECFLGIPYAKPPLGQRRFTLPEPFGHVGDFDATRLGASCVQRGNPPKPLESMSEDCLFLNVFRPTGTTSQSKKAVAVIIHGGGFSLGSSSEPQYQGAPLAAHGDLVVVTLNYRLGIFGFAGLSHLGPSNLGLYDQRLALHWVQQNIQSFGGNPDQVTLIGVSAGSMAICGHIITPLKDEKPLFHSVVMDAGVLAIGMVEPMNESFARIKTISKKLGCETDGPELLECLRSASAETLLELSVDVEGFSPILTFLPTNDGVFLPEDITTTVCKHADRFRKVRMIIGNSKDEGSLFSAYYLDGRQLPRIESEQEFVDWCAKLSRVFQHPINLKEDADLREKLCATYYRKNPQDPFRAAGRMIGDGTFIGPTNIFVKNYAAHNKHVYFYRFERCLLNTYIYLNPEHLGAFHFSPFLHFTASLLDSANPTPVTDETDRKYMLDCVKTVSDFVRNDGSPLVFRGLEWPDFSSAPERLFVFNEEPSLRNTIPRSKKVKALFGFLEVSS